MNHWEHLMDIPPEVRQTMASAFLIYEKQDLGVEGMVDALYQAPRVTQAAVRSLQATANYIRVPDLCRIVKTAHPGLSWRDVFKAAALFCGLHHKHVQKLYYPRRAQ